MANHETELRNGHRRTTFRLEPGETVKLCRCFQSKTFPFCDEAHKTLDNDWGPVVIIVNSPLAPDQEGGEKPQDPRIR